MVEVVERREIDILDIALINSFVAKVKYA